jgi:hypothetical protein
VGDKRIQAAEAEIIWAAGFWDGEGSCGCYVKSDGRARIASGWTLRVHIFQNHREPLDRFAKAMGVGRVYGPYVQATKKNEHYNYQCTGEATKVIFDLLLPWICEPKRQQILAALEKFSKRPEPRIQGKGGTKPCPPGCTCGRHTGWWKTHSKDESKTTEHRRAQQREYQRRYRAKKKGVAP